MGEKLLKYYQYIWEIKKLQGRIDLALKTDMPTRQASQEPDSNENIKKFRKAVEEITGKEAPKY